MPVSGLAVTDELAGCTVGDVPASVPAKDTVRVSYSCSFDQFPGTVTNVATVTWDKAAAYASSGTASASVEVDFAKVTPVISNDQVVVTDDTTGQTLGTAKAIDGATQFPVTLTVKGTPGTCKKVTNTASLVDAGVTEQASASTDLCSGADLSVAKTATGSYDSTYTWDIAKTATPARQVVAAGENGTVNYAVTVTPVAETRAGYSLGGSITVTNPNDWEAVTATVTDLVDIDGVSCSIEGLNPDGTISLAASQAKTLTYTCAFASDPASLAGTNTATATWDAATAHTTHGSATGTAKVALVQNQATNKVITVSDPMYTAPDQSHVLGSLDWADGPHTFTYQAHPAGTAGTCVRIDNTATIDQTGQQASADATVCTAADLTATVTGTGSYVRTYPWTIAKAADQTRFETSDTAITAHYTVTATAGAPVDSAYVVTGTITVHNPNDFEAVDITGVTDQLPRSSSAPRPRASPHRSPTTCSSPALLVPAPSTRTRRWWT